MKSHKSNILPEEVQTTTPFFVKRGAHKSSASDVTQNQPNLQRKCTECEQEEQFQQKENISIQRKENDSSILPSPPAETPTESSDAASAPVAARFIIEDNAQPEEGKMRKSDFLDRMNSEICGTVNEGLAGTPFSADSCPYIRRSLERHRNSSPVQIEIVIARYAPSATTAQSVEGLIQAVKTRVGTAVTQWVQTGDLSGVPEEIAAQMPGGLSTLANAASVISGIASGVGSGISSFATSVVNMASSIGSGIGGLFFKRKAGGAQPNNSPLGVMNSLGKGQPLEGSVRGKMEGAFGANFANVEVHTDSNAANLSSNMNARAFTVGNHVAFGSGEYQPGTLMGDGLLAHELAHVEQQKGFDIKTKSMANGTASEEEKEADNTAVLVAMSISDSTQQNVVSEKKHSKTGFKISRCSKGATRPADLHAGTQVPDSTRLGRLRGELAPGSVSAGGVPLRWDGAATSTGTLTPLAITNRTNLKRDLTAAMQQHLNNAMLSIRPQSTMARIPITEFEGPGRAAKQVVDSRFMNYMAQAALTPLQARTRRTFAFSASGPNQNLFDANDRTERARAGFAVSAEDLADWIGSSDPTATTVNLSHNFNTDSGVDGQAQFFENEVLTPFVAANSADLELYDLFGFAMSDESTGRIVIGTVPDQSLSSTSSTPGVPSPAIRKTKWEAWKTLVHEYFHQLAHPTFNSAASGGQVNSRVMTEGFAELFTKEVLTAELPGAASNTALRNTIEGGSFPAPTPDIVGVYQTPPDYADYLTRVENIRDGIIGPVGGNQAVKAAFFQGHVEFIGLNPNGTWITPVGAGMADVVAVPAGISSLSDLSTATGLSIAEIQAANPGLTTSSPLPSTVHAPGCREHIVLEARNIGARGSIVGRQTESKTQIANQNGVTEADLDRANPSVNWSSLVEGQKILIPKH